MTETASPGRSRRRRPRPPSAPRSASTAAASRTSRPPTSRAQRRPRGRRSEPASSPATSGTSCSATSSTPSRATCTCRASPPSTAACPIETPALTVNRLCGSGLQAIVSAAQTIKLGEADVAVAGGAESMSRAPVLAARPALGPADERRRHRRRDGRRADRPVRRLHMGITAENVAEKWGISREDQDALAVESHRRAAAAPGRGLLQGADRPGRDQGPQGRDVRSTPTSTSAPTSPLERHGQAAAGLQARTARSRPATPPASTTPPRRSSWPRAARPSAAGLTPLGRLVAYATPASTRSTWASARSRRSRSVLDRGRARRSTTSTCSRSTRPSPRRRSPSPATSACPPRRPTRTAAASRLGHPIGATGAILVVKALLRARPHRRPLRRSSRCASAAARASPPSSSGSESPWLTGPHPLARRTTRTSSSRARLRRPSTSSWRRTGSPTCSPPRPRT